MLIPAVWPRGQLADAVPLQRHSRQSKQKCPSLAVRQYFLASQLPPCPEPGCTPGGRQHLLAPHRDPSALASALLIQQRTGFDVSALLLLCALGETTTRPRALPSTQSSRSNFSHRLAVRCANSDLPHRSRQGCNFSLTERQKSPRDILPQKLTNLNGTNFLGVDLFLLVRDTVSWDVSLESSSSNCFEVRHQLRIEQEAALFRQVSRGPLDRENVKTPEQASSLSSSCEGDNGVQMFLPFASRTKSTHWRQFNVGQRRNTCFASTLLSHRAPRQFVSPSTPGNSSRLGALRTGGMSSNARAPWDESCNPVSAAVCRAMRGAANKSLHGFADGPSGCQGARSFPALFACLWPHLVCCPAKRSRVLLTRPCRSDS